MDSALGRRTPSKAVDDEFEVAVSVDSVVGMHTATDHELAISELEGLCSRSREFPIRGLFPAAFRHIRQKYYVIMLYLPV